MIAFEEMAIAYAKQVLRAEQAEARVRELEAEIAKPTAKEKHE